MVIEIDFNSDEALYFPAAAHDGDGPGLALCLGDVARFPQAFQVEVDGGRGFQVYRCGDLPHGGGVAVLVGKGQDVIVDLLLLGGQFTHNASSFQI